MIIIHRKNPSGFHNKIKWVLKHCHRNIKELDEMQIICTNNFYNKKDYQLVKISWDLVFKIARFKITKETSNKSFKGDRERVFIKRLSLNAITDRLSTKNPYGLGNSYVSSSKLDTYLNDMYNKYKV